MTFKDSGSRTEFETGARRDCQEGKGRMDLLPFRAIMAVSKIYETGCIKYGDRNWEKGIPLSRYIDSGMRHLSKWMIGADDEPHLDMAIWNLLGARDTVARIQEGLLPESLNDLPCNPYFKPEVLRSVKDVEEALGIDPTSWTPDTPPTGVAEAMAHCMAMPEPADRAMKDMEKILARAYCKHLTRAAVQEILDEKEDDKPQLDMPDCEEETENGI